MHVFVSSKYCEFQCHDNGIGRATVRSVRLGVITGLCGVVPLGTRSTRHDETSTVVVTLHEVLWLVVRVVVAVLGNVLRRARIAARIMHQQCFNCAKFLPNIHIDYC